MRKSERDREDVEFLLSTGRAARARGLPSFEHLDQPVGVWTYIRIANEIERTVPPGRVLDWGCGFGQMTYLLRRRGFEVVPYDVRPAGYRLPDVPLCASIDLVCSAHPTQLPFGDGAFDAVLSCGVLEHVDEQSEPGNERKSLREIHRVLRPTGDFLIYQLPQRWSWTEAMQRRLRRGYWHPRRYSAREIRRILREARFEVERVARFNMLPKSMQGLPAFMRNLYGRFGRAVDSLDRVLCRAPGLNVLAGVLEVRARPAR